MKNAINILLIVCGGLVAIVGLIGFFSKPAGAQSEQPEEEPKEEQPQVK